MADKKWTALDAITSVTTDDVLCVVDDVSGTPTSKKVTFDNLQKSLSTIGGVGGVKLQGPVYLSGSESVDGSCRLYFDSATCALQFRVSGSWVSSAEWTAPS